MEDETSKVGKEGAEMSTVSIPEPPNAALHPLARMKQGFQEAMKKKGLTEEDVRKIIGIKRYEKKD